MIITFVYLFLQFIPIGRVHDYYMMPLLPWLYIFVAFGVHFVNKFEWGKYFVALFILWGIIYTPKNAEEKWSIEQSYFNKDIYVHDDDLKNAVPNDAHCIILNDISSHIFSYKIDKMGYVFDGD